MGIGCHRSRRGIYNDSLASRKISCQHCRRHLRRRMQWNRAGGYPGQSPEPKSRDHAVSSQLPLSPSAGRSCARPETIPSPQKLVAAITAPPQNGAVAASSVSCVTRGVPAAQTRRDKLGVMTAAAGARTATETAAGSARCTASGTQNPEEGH